LTTSKKIEPVRRILVPLDGSKLCEAVIPYVTGFASATGALLVLFRAADSESAVAGADDYLEQIAAGIRKTGMGVATHSYAGQPAEAIVKAARNYEADIIAMTGHARPGGRKDLIGSAAQGVLSQCETPVLALRTADTAWVQPSAIVAGLDGSEDARLALKSAVSLAQQVKCELAMVRAVEAVAPLGGAARYYGAVDDFAKEYLAKLKDELASTGLRITTHTGKRPPEQELLGVAGSRPGSIIVVATSGLSGKSGVLGSTTDRLVRAQSHPVMAVPAR
jgi:nucleotide-binding universal stress UspA family protein